MHQWLKTEDLKHEVVTSENMKQLRQSQNNNESQGPDRCAIDLGAHHGTVTASRA